MSSYTPLVTAAMALATAAALLIPAYGGRHTPDVGVSPDDHPKPAGMTTADWCHGAVTPDGIAYCLRQWGR